MLSNRLNVLRLRDFRVFAIGYATSTVGTAMSSVALAFAVLGSGGSPGTLSLVLAARIARRGQRSVDAVYGTAIAELRSAVRRALAQMALDSAWDKRFPRAALCRNSLAMAADAQPGALFALTEHVLVDLAAAPTGEPVVEEVRRRLAQALSR